MKDMLGRASAIEAEAALSLIMQTIENSGTGTSQVPIENALGRVMAQSITSTEDIPGFSRSTMDGFAVRASDTFGATETSPAYLEISGEVLMGQEADITVAPGKAVRIATGGMLPRGADAVLMLEYATAIDNTMIEAQKAMAPGENVIQRGEDMSGDEEILAQGVRLRPQDVAVLASAGVTSIETFNAPTVAIISTGDELVPPSHTLKPGQIRDSNSYLLSALCESAGAVPMKMGILPDIYEEIRNAVQSASEQSNMVLISGGSSVGTRDMTERVLSDLGSIMFHSVRLKPGKPFLAGTINGRPVFGLPGHPRAVAVCFEAFIRPALRKLSGETGPALRSTPRTMEARLLKNVHSSPGRREHIDVILSELDGQIWADPVRGKSGLLRTMVRADGNICVPQEKIGWAKGDKVKVTLF